MRVKCKYPKCTFNERLPLNLQARFYESIRGILIQFSILKKDNQLINDSFSKYMYFFPGLWEGVSCS